MLKLNWFRFGIYISILFQLVYSNQLQIRAPSVFRYDEINYHKYSAILAATEPFKIQCIAQIKKSLGPFQLLSYWIRGFHTYLFNSFIIYICICVSLIYLLKIHLLYTIIHYNQ